MNKINKNDNNKLKDEQENRILSIFCSDMVGVSARVTFDSCTIDGIQVTFWMDEDEDIKERVNNMFDILFEEVVKSREKISKKQSVIKIINSV